MIAYQKRQLPADDVGEPGDLPAELQGLADISLADLIWTDAALGYHGFGYFPVEVEDPVVPTTRVITRLQWILACKHLDILDPLVTYIEGLATDNATRLYFENSANFDRDDPRYDALETGLGATEENTDAVYDYGSTLDP